MKAPSSFKNVYLHREPIDMRKAINGRSGKRKPLPEDLPREVVTIELNPEEQFAEDGTPLKVIGEEVSEKLIYTPASMKIQEIHRLVFQFSQI